MLEKNDIEETGAVALANAIGNNQMVRKLVLKGNAISVCNGPGAAAKALGEMLLQNQMLEVLDLSLCSIGNKGGVEIGNGLVENSTLKELLLGKNSLGGGSNIGFISGLCKNSSLAVLHINANCFGADGMKCGEFPLQKPSNPPPNSSISICQKIHLHSRQLSTP